MPATLRRTDEALEVDLSTCRGTDFTDTLAKVKEIPGRRYDGAHKLWLLPNEASAAERAINALDPIVDIAITDWVNSERAQTEQELVTSLPEDSDDLFIAWANERTDWQPQEINGEPYTGLKAHQRSLIAALAGQGDEIRAIVADDMGLGKTVQAISTVAEVAVRQAKALPELGPKLIVCPSSVKGVWEREIVRWLGPDEYAINVKGTTPKARQAQLLDGINENAWTIINYEQLRVQKEKKKLRNGGEKTIKVMKQPLFEQTNWAVVAADEAHRAKNRKASQTQGLFRTRGQIMLALTGTPLMNSPDELWALLHWLYPKEYTSYWRFYETYVDYTEGYKGRVVTGVKNPDALRFELHGRMYRRTKAQVLDLPEKQRIIVPVMLGDKQRALYTEAERNLWLEVENAISEGDQTAERLVEAAASGTNIYTIPNGAARTVRLREILSSPALLGGEDESAKLDACVDRITDNAHKQHVVFTEFVGTCKLLVERLARQKITAIAYTGEVSTTERTQIEDDFQNEEFKVIVGTIPAMREGITLTAADTVHFIERSWVPAWNEQSEDRLHRIGQRNPVTVLIYEAQETVDDGKVSPTNRRKERIVSAVLPKDIVKEA